MKKSDDTITHEFTLDRIEGKMAVLLDEADESIDLPASLLPKGITAGEVLVITISSQKAETARREKKAKDLLNEILNPKSDDF